jgi:hypothetical protein
MRHLHSRCSCVFIIGMHIIGNQSFRTHPIVSGRRSLLGNDDWFEAILVFYVLPLVQTDISEVVLRNKLHLGEV